MELTLAEGRALLATVQSILVSQQTAGWMTSLPTVSETRPYQPGKCPSAGAWAAVLFLSTALVSLTGFPLPSPPGTPTPDPARIVGVIELVLVLIAALALYVYHLARFWRAVYIVTITLAVYFNVFVTVVQAFMKIGFLHALAPTGKEPPFLIAQLLALVLLIVIGVTAFRRFHRSTAQP